MLDALNAYNAAVSDLKITEKILAEAGANPKRSALVPFFSAALNSAKKIVAECEADTSDVRSPALAV
jgi:hypothetical protein